MSNKLHKPCVFCKASPEIASKDGGDFRKSVRISPHLLKKEAYDHFLWRIRVGQGDAEYGMPPLLVVHDGGRQ